MVVRRPAAIPPPPSTHKTLDGVKSKPTLVRYRSVVVPGLRVAYSGRTIGWPSWRVGSGIRVQQPFPPAINEPAGSPHSYYPMVRVSTLYILLYSTKMEREESAWIWHPSDSDPPLNSSRLHPRRAMVRDHLLHVQHIIKWALCVSFCVPQLHR